MAAGPTMGFDKCCLTSVLRFLLAPSTVSWAAHRSVIAHMPHHASGKASGSCSKAAHSRCGKSPTPISPCTTTHSVIIFISCTPTLGSSTSHYSTLAAGGFPRPRGSAPSSSFPLFGLCLLSLPLPNHRLQPLSDQLEWGEGSQEITHLLLLGAAPLGEEELTSVYRQHQGNPQCTACCVLPAALPVCPCAPCCVPHTTLGETHIRT